MKIKFLILLSLILISDNIVYGWVPKIDKPEVNTEKDKDDRYYLTNSTATIGTIPLKVYIEYGWNEAYYFCLNEEEKDLKDGIFISVSDSSEQELEKYKLKKQKNGFTILVGDKKRAEWIYDIKKSSRTIKIYRETSNKNPIKYNVEINIEKSNRNTIYNNSKRWGVSESKDLNKNIDVISNININYNRNENRSIYRIPVSAYSDLANPKKFTVWSLDNGFMIEILCGKREKDLYIAKLIVINGNISRREIRKADTSNKLIEEELYSFENYYVY